MSKCERGEIWFGCFDLELDIFKVYLFRIINILKKCIF